MVPRKQTGDDSQAELDEIRRGGITEAIKQMDARITQRLDAMTVEMKTFLEALNRMERGIDRMASSWEGQLKLMDKMISNQQQMVNTQAKTVDRLLDAIYPKEAT